MSELTLNDLFAIKPEIKKFEIEGKAKAGSTKRPIIGHVYAKEFTSRDRRKIWELIGEDESRIPAVYVIYGVCDKDGNRKFVESDEIPIEELVERVANLPDMHLAQMLTAVNDVNKNDEKTTAKN